MIKLYAQKNIFTLIKEKYGQSAIKLARLIEKYRSKVDKIKYDIKFLLTCKRNNLTPTFAKPRFSIKVSRYTRNRITRTILQQELQNKHKKLKQLKERLDSEIDELKDTVGFITFCTFNKITFKTLSRKRKQWKTTHEKKLSKLFETANPPISNNCPKNMIHNLSSKTLSMEEEVHLSFGLDHPIPTKLNKNSIKTEFEGYFYQLNKELSHLPTSEISELKSKLRRHCENYHNIKPDMQVHHHLRNLSKDKDIAILKQDKGRGAVILDKSKYTEKCLSHLNTPNFIKLPHDVTKATEEKVQKALFKIKKYIGKESYNEIYPSGSNPGKFYGTAKIHKVNLNDNNVVDNLPLRPIISNIGTATHKTAQYLSKLLSPLAKSRYTIDSSKQFVGQIKEIVLPDHFEMISFDVVSLFTNVPLDFTIELVLKKLYIEKLIITKIPKINMKELLYLCTKTVPFSFDNNLYMQVEGVAMGSPLGPLLANVFMCELESTIIPKLADEIFIWRRYVDDTFAIIKTNMQDKILEELNNFHQNLQFTYEKEKDKTISFLDVKIMRDKENGSTLNTAIYRKSTHTNIYINWNSHSPTSWKIGTIKTLVKRAFDIVSTKKHLEEELKFLLHTFSDLNQYPKQLVESIISQER